MPGFSSLFGSNFVVVASFGGDTIQEGFQSSCLAVD